MTDTHPTPNNGSKFMGLLFLVLLVLKLTGIITWSWWWITAPLWAGAALLILFTLIIALAAFIKQIASALGGKK